MRTIVAAFAAALLFSACQDPAGVGLGLIDEEQLDPNVRTVLLTDVATSLDTTIAIGIADAGQPTRAQSRVLVGSVVDPAFGDARAVAYVDFLQSTALGSSADASQVSAVWLELTRSYVYGDTTTTLPLELRAIQGSWEIDTGYARDTLFATGPALATTEVTAADSTRRFDLPADWVAANAATLVSSDFSDQFEGFAIDVPAAFAASPGAIYGFDTFASTGAGLRVVVAEDTLLYPLSEVFTSISGQAPAVAGTSLPVRAGSGQFVSFAADFATVGPSALARAQLRIPVDESLAQQGAFVRPIPQLAVLYGVRDGADGGRAPIASVNYLGDGLFRISDTSLLTPIVQGILLDPTLAFDRFEIGPALGTASLDIFPVALPASDGPLPRFTLTVVGAAG